MVMLNDKRPLLTELLHEHAAPIAALKAKIQHHPCYVKDRYDDIWILRFFLSHKNVTKASAAAIDTMEYRSENKLNEMGDIRHKLFDHTNPHSELNFDVHKKYLSMCHSWNAVMHTLPNLDHGLVTYILAKNCPMSKLASEMTAEEIQDVYMLTNESIYQILDEISRRTGRLTKLLRVIDLKGVSLSSFNLEYARRDAACNKELQNYYPQLLGSVLFVNPPSFMLATWKIVLPLFPKSFAEKIQFVCPSKNPNDIKYFLRYVKEDDLDERYGGNNKVWPPPCQLKRRLLTPSIASN